MMPCRHCKVGEERAARQPKAPQSVIRVPVGQCPADTCCQESLAHNCNAFWIKVVEMLNVSRRRGLFGNSAECCTKAVTNFKNLIG